MAIRKKFVQNPFEQETTKTNPKINSIFQIQPPALVPKLIRKPSIEREIPSLQYHRGSPALDSGAGSSRSDSPHQHPHLGGKFGTIFSKKTI